MEVKDTFFSRKYTLKCKGHLIDLSVPRVMGILNVTPDSFYDGGKYTTEKEILGQTEKMLLEGADFIDIGAFSTRPGAGEISTSEEIKRLEKAISPIRKKFGDVFISIDTFRSEVARFAVNNFEADLINDISAGLIDENLINTVSELGVPYIMMHMKGTPKTMQVNPVYENITKEIIYFFSERLEKSKIAGINDIIIDPGFGFGKTIHHNFQLLNELDTFKFFELPVMVGLSRKSMIYKTLDISSDEALNGTTVVNTIALLKGADILRVHDVKEAKEAIKLVENLKKATTS